jgi:hypothetical protein
MSAGVFSEGYYKGDDGTYYPCRYQIETVITDVNEPFTTVDGATAVSSVSARLSGNRRKFGVNARYVSCKWNGSPPTGYAAAGRIRIPFFDKAQWDDISKGDLIPYLGASLKVIGKENERIR